MNGGASGRLDNLKDDVCYLNQRLTQNQEIMKHMLYDGKYENAQKCVFDKSYFPRPFDSRIVNVESELLGLTRPASKCNNMKYRSDCKKTALCMSTFDKSAPVVLPPEACPIISTGLPKITSSGFSKP